MTLSDQSAILLAAIENDLIQPEDIVRWADAAIVTLEKPPAWIIELSTLSSPHLADFERQLRKQSPMLLPMRRKVQIIVLGHKADLLSLPDTLSKLFRLRFTNIIRGEREPFDDQLASALIEWDDRLDLDLDPKDPLRGKFTSLFREYLKDADEIAEVLPWKFRKAA
jgi:hypothetical protein